MARVSGHDYPDEAEIEEANGTDDDGEEEGEEEEEQENDECVGDDGGEGDGAVVCTTPCPKNPDLSPVPRSTTPSPAKLHDAIRPSPTAAPSGSSAIRSCIEAKRQLIKELELELGITCFDRIIET